MLLACNSLKLIKPSFLTAKGYRPSKVMWALKGDWEPGPYPQTKEERVKAAHKYGLIADDYQTYPDDGRGIGDYPNLPLISGLKRDPYYSWNSDLYRDYKEPVHITWAITSDRYDPNFTPKGGWFLVVVLSWGTLIGFGLLTYLLSPFQVVWPVMDKVYPYEYQEAITRVRKEGIYPRNIPRRIHFGFPETQGEEPHAHH